MILLEFRTDNVACIVVPYGMVSLCGITITLLFILVKMLSLINFNIKQEEPIQHQQLKRIRKNLNGDFLEIGGFLLPYPGKAVATNHRFGGLVKGRRYIYIYIPFLNYYNVHKLCDRWSNTDFLLFKQFDLCKKKKRV